MAVSRLLNSSGKDICLRGRLACVFEKVQNDWKTKAVTGRKQNFKMLAQ